MSTQNRGNYVAQFLVEDISDRLEAALHSDRTPRLICPMCTRELAKLVHDLLLQKNVNSVLVAEDLSYPTTEVRSSNCITSVEKMVTFRLKPVVYILEPGLLTLVPQSLRGSGGTSLELEVSERWPLDSEGRSISRLLDYLAKHKWKFLKEDTDYFKNIFKQIVVPSLSRRPDGPKLIIESILTLDESAELGTENLRSLCSSIGILWSRKLDDREKKPPYTSKALKNLAAALRSVELNADALARLDIVCDNETATEREEKLKDLQALQDGLVQNEFMLGGLMELSSGLRRVTRIRGYRAIWIDYETLRDFLDIPPDKKIARIEFTEVVAESHLIGTVEYSPVVFSYTDRFELIRFQLNFEVNEEDLKIIIRAGGKKLASNVLTQHQNTELFEISFDDLPSYKTRNKHKIVAEIVSGDVVLDATSVDLYLIRQDQAIVFCAKDNGQWQIVESEQPIAYSLDLKTKICLFVGDTLANDFTWHIDSESQTVTTRRGTSNLTLLEKVDFIELEPKDIVAAESLLEIVQTSDNEEHPRNNFEITLVAADSTSGFYTVDRMLEDKISKFKGSVSSNLAGAIDHYQNREKDITSKLGIPENCKVRSKLALNFEKEDEYSFVPLLTNFFADDSNAAISFSTSVESPFVKLSKAIDENPFSIHTKLSTEIANLVDEYRINRSKVMNIVLSDHNLEAHPRHCYTPVYTKHSETEMHDALVTYLNGYTKLVILATRLKNRNFLDRYLALNIDCALSISKDEKYSKYSDLKLFGPWHPLVVTQRFYYQKSLANYASRIIEPEYKKDRLLPKLTSLLRSNILAHATASKGVHSEQLSLLKTTNDSGWIVALPESVMKNFSDLQRTNPTRLAEDKKRFFDCCGFDLFAEDQISSSIFSETIKKYLLSSPSSNRIGVRVGSGFPVKEVIADVSSSLVNKDGDANELHYSLAGGVDLVVDELHPVDAVSPALEIAESGIPIRIFTNNKSPSEDSGVDISFLSSSGDGDLIGYHNDFGLHLLRGTGASFLLSRRPMETYPQSDSIGSIRAIYEVELNEKNTDEPQSLELATNAMVTALQSPDLSGQKMMLAIKGSVPMKPTGRWEYMSGDQTDPHLLSRYLENNRDRSLWDLSYTLGEHGGCSHYVVSKHSNLLLSSLRATIGDAVDSLEDVLLDMAKIGSPLLRESNGTLNKAKGCAGLVAAKRLIPLNELNELGLVSVLISIDSFDELIGAKSSSGADGDTRMGDLLLLTFKLDQKDSTALDIRATAIEAKYRTTIPSPGEVTGFFNQTTQSIDRIERLFQIGKELEMLPCRIAIMEIIEFGLRLINVDKKITDNILQIIMNGTYNWSDSALGSLVTVLTPDINCASNAKKYSHNGLLVSINLSDFPTSLINPTSPSYEIKNKILDRLTVCNDNRLHDDAKRSDIDFANKETDSKDENLIDTDENEDAVRKSSTKMATRKKSTLQKASDTSSDKTKSNALKDRAKKERRQEILLNGYIVVSKLLNSWNIKLESVDNTDLKRDTPSCYRFQYKLTSTKDISKASRAEFLTAIKYELALDESAQIAVSVSRGYLVFEIAKNVEDKYPVLASALWNDISYADDRHSRLAIAIGESVSTGDPVIIDFVKLPHLLIAGQTGAGKSIAIETIVEGLTKSYPPEFFELAIVDFKGVDFLKYQNSRHLVSPIAGDSASALALLQDLVEITNERLALFAEHRVKNLREYNTKFLEKRLPFKMVVIDEFAELVLDDSTKSQITALVQSIAQKSRAAGTHLIVCTQYPRGDVVDRLITANLPGRLCLKVPDSTASNLVINKGGAEKLSLNGDALYIDGASGAERLQIAIVDV